MDKDINISQNCKQGCLDNHARGSKNHKTIPLKRFKNRITEFMSADDQYWLDAFEKIQSISEAVDKLKEDLNQKILEKRLMYTLNYDNSGQLYKLFKLANQNQFSRLTCEDAAMIENKIDKKRDIQPNAIRTVIKELFIDAEADIVDTIKGILRTQERRERNQRGGRRDEREVRRDDRDRDRRPRREEERREVRQDRGARDNDQIRDNGLPTVKVNKVEDCKGNFNIYVKIGKILKNFSYGKINKIQFEGGDQTGTAIFVVNDLRCIRQGNVIHISNASIYSFHGQKQIQQHQKNSYISQMPKMTLNISDKYIFSKKKRGGYYRGDGQKSQISKTESNRSHQVENRPVRNRNNEDFDQSIRRGRGNREQNRAHQYRKRQADDDEEVQVDQSRRDTGRQRPDRDYGDREERGRGNRDQRQGYRGRQNRQDRGRGYRGNRGERQRGDRGDRGARGERINERNRYNTNWESDQEKKQQNRPKREEKKKAESSDEQGEPYIQPKKQESKGKKVEQIGQGKKKPTKIKDLEPGDENINIVAEILEINNDVEVNKGCIFCVIGDDTGTVWAELPQHHPDVKINVVVFLESVDSEVHESRKRLIIRMNQGSLVHRTSMKLTTINLDVRMSEQEWQSEQEGQEGQEGQEDQEEASQEGEEPQEEGKGENKPGSSIIEDF